MAAMFSCVNASYVPGSTALTWEAAMRDELERPSLRASAAFWTSSGDGPATVVTSASVGRLPQLYAQCRTWAGPLSVVLYDPLFQPTPGELTPENQAELRAAVLQVARFIVDVQSMPNACKPDVLLTWELFLDERGSKMLYPINGLRNLAKLQARTPLVVLMDVDLVISRGLSARLLDRNKAAPLITKARNRTAFVIPAFDVNRQVDRAAWADALASGDKEMLGRAFDTRLVFQFDVRGFPRGHGPTDYRRWFGAKEDYMIRYEEDFEPWIVAHREALPWHDPRFWGYGYNKVQYIANLNGLGFKFGVLHDAFTIHRAHRPAEATTSFLRHQHARRPATSPNLYTHNIKLYRDQCAMHQLRLPFIPPRSPATESCLRALPWWQGWSDPPTPNANTALAAEIAARGLTASGSGVATQLLAAASAPATPPTSVAAL